MIMNLRNGHALSSVGCTVRFTLHTTEGKNLQLD